MKFSLFTLATLMLAAAIVVAGCKPQIEPKELQENATECAADVDCGVGGCSGQVCTAAKEAEGLITTCEYREEYGCLKLTSCGCVEGRCMWRQNSEYNACLGEAKSPKP